jgi:hypothetical protein
MFYVEAENLFERGIFFRVGVTTDDEYKQWSSQIEDFSRRLEKWVIDSMGQGARARLLHYSLPPNLNIRNTISDDHRLSMIALMMTKENIDQMIKTPSWDKP